MKVCFFGLYVMDDMNSLLKKKLELKGIEVVECQEQIRNNFFLIIPTYLKLFLKIRKLDYDIIIIPRWRGGLALPLAKFISKKPILYYSYAMPYDIFIEDRKMFKQNSIMAKLISFWCKLCLKLSNVTILETNVDINYKSNKFKIDKKKLKRIFIGADDTLFPCCLFKAPDTNFTILYFGKFVPLHGLEQVIEAAKILSEHKEIIFKFCGDGQSKNTMMKLVTKYNLKNVKFLGFVKHEVLIKNINHSDVCLGIFGDSIRGTRVITNKVYQILCSQKPLITRNSEATKEIGLTSNKNCILVSGNNPMELADAILNLKNNVNKRREISESGNKLYQEKLSMEKTSAQIIDLLNELIIKNK